MTAGKETASAEGLSVFVISCLAEKIWKIFPYIQNIEENNCEKVISRGKNSARRIGLIPGLWPAPKRSPSAVSQPLKHK